MTQGWTPKLPPLGQSLLRWSATTALPATPARRGAGGRRRRRKWRLWSKNLGEGGIGAHLVHIAAAHADRTNQLILHNDRESATHEVISEAGGLTEVQANHSSVNGVEALRHGA